MPREGAIIFGDLAGKLDVLRIELCLSQTSSGWQMIANRAMLSPDVGPLQTDLVGARRPVPIETGARGGEPGAAPADQRPAADRAKEASPQQHRPIDIRRPFWLFPDVRGALAIVKPDTVIRWHRAGFRA